MRTIPNLNSTNEVLQHIRDLQLAGYERTGNWSLGQICNHLARSIDLTLNGPAKFIPRFVQRLFIGTFLKLSVLGKIGAVIGLRIPTGLPQKEHVDDTAGINQFKDKLQRLQDPAAAHLLPFHLWHCRHHLAFLVSKANAAEIVPPHSATGSAI